MGRGGGGGILGLEVTGRKEVYTQLGFGFGFGFWGLVGCIFQEIKTGLFFSLRAFELAIAPEHPRSS